MMITVDEPLYRYRVYDQRGDLCYEVGSWRRLPPELFRVFLNLGDPIMLERIVVSGQGEDGVTYHLYHGRDWLVDPDTVKPRGPIRVVAGKDIA